MTKVLQEKLKELVTYDQDTGKFYRVKSFRRWKAGEEAGSIDITRGYVQFKFNGRNDYGHRLAWLYVFGELPVGVDHINGNKADNRICNLRVANQSQNLQNKCPYNKKTNNPIGVSFDKRSGKWRSRLTKNKKEMFSRLFETKNEAKDAYLAAKKIHHDFNPVQRGVAA